MPNKTFDFLIGADPEFTCLFNGQRVSAAEVNESLFGAHSFRIKTGEFGCDGCAATGELRPEAESSPAGLTNNIEQLFKKFFTKGHAFELNTLSLWGPCGGHIHLDCPDHLEDELQRKLLFLTLPLTLNELLTDATVRKSSGYGRDPFDLRFETKSKGKTIEIRHPSAQWLTTKKIAEATLATLGVIWHEITKNKAKLPAICDVEKEAIRGLYNLTSTANVNQFLGKSIESIKDIIRGFERYEDFKDEIEYIFDSKKVLNDKKKVGFSINKGWGFNTTTKLTKSALLRSPKISSDISGPWCAVNHNGDIGTELFAEELKKRILSGIELKQSYFIFGIRRQEKAKSTGLIVAQGENLYTVPPIESEAELEQIKDCISHLNEKIHIVEKIKIDFESERIISDRSKPFLIGIPREMRDAKDVKSFMKLIYSIEHGDLQPIPASAFKDLKKKIKKSPQRIEETTIKLDTSSQGRRLAEVAISELPSDLITHISTTRIPESDDFELEASSESSEELPVSPRRNTILRHMEEHPVLDTGTSAQIQRLLSNAVAINIGDDIPGFLVGISATQNKFLVYVEDNIIERVHREGTETIFGAHQELVFNLFYPGCPNLFETTRINVPDDGDGDFIGGWLPEMITNHSIPSADLEEMALRIFISNNGNSCVLPCKLKSNSVLDIYPAPRPHISEIQFADESEGSESSYLYELPTEFSNAGTEPFVASWRRTHSYPTYSEADPT